MINDAVITYFGKQTRVVCDRNCGKAWGSTQRPTLPMSDEDDDVYFFGDDELGEAPADPGTYEGDDGKPESPDWFPTRWCVRECERCNITPHGGDWREPVPIPDLSQGWYNMPQLHEQTD